MKENNSKDKTIGLRNYAEQRSKDIYVKANKIIDEMVQNNQRITFDAVACAAGVSRGTLYNYPQIKERIITLRNKQQINENRSEVAPKTNNQNDLKDKIAIMNKRIKQLEDDKKKLIAQLVEFETMKEENIRLKQTLLKYQ